MARDKRLLSARLALEWAFGVEYAQLDLHDDEAAVPVGVDRIYRMQEHKRLGVSFIDGGGKSLPHDDAEIIAAALTTFGKRRGMGGVAILCADRARRHTVPNWMPGARPKIVPSEMRRLPKGQPPMAKTEVLRRYVMPVTRPHPRYPDKTTTHRVKVEESWCPCFWEVSLGEIQQARKAYGQWVLAIQSVRDTLLKHGDLETIEITNKLPPRRPWASPRA